MNQSTQNKPNILLVDDRPENLLVLKEILGTTDQNLVMAKSGEEALKQILEKDFAAILLDVQMPGIDGFETAALIRQRRQTTNTPIIFITAESQTNETMFRGYGLGAVDFLFKPIVPDILRTKVKVFANLFTMRQEIETNARRINAINQQLEQEILERSRAQAEVMKLNRFLEEKIRELDLSNKELEAFSYSVSHDLRAPLRSIDGFSLMLLEEYTEKLDETEKGYLHRIRAASQRLEQIIDDLLRLSRIMRNDMRLEPIDLSGLVRSISGAFQDASPNRKVELITAPNVMVMADMNLIQLAMENLVNNAWKYTSQKTDARIEFGVDSRGTELTNPKTLCFIRDNGAGFDMSLSDKLFTPFQRLHSKSQFPGTGIGLAIVQRVIHRHGGNIRAEAEVGKGATFYFTLSGTQGRPLR
jgi:two-component system sensor histidine kinase/response regulator